MIKHNEIYRIEDFSKKMHKIGLARLGSLEQWYTEAAKYATRKGDPKPHVIFMCLRRSSSLSFLTSTNS